MNIFFTLLAYKVNFKGSIQQGERMTVRLYSLGKQGKDILIVEYRVMREAQTYRQVAQKTEIARTTLII